jgi:phospholipid/cholesterol/gamma-HCH transport system permease protein
MILEAHIRRLGAFALAGVDALGSLGGVAAHTVRRAGRAHRKDLVEQMFQIGNRSLLFVFVTLGFLGMVLVFQTCLQIGRVTGDLSQVGAEFIKIVTHEFGPTITAMMLATRVGAGIAAEIGSMTVTEQVDALRMCAVDPVEYLIVPRFIASLVMELVLTVLGVVVAVGLGAMTAALAFRVNPHVFLDATHVARADVLVGLVKCVAYGAAIPIVSGFCGLRARGGSEGVGEATKLAVIGSSFAVLVIDFLISTLGYFFVQRGGLR